MIMMQKNSQITELQVEIDSIREYISTDLCRKCEEMSIRLKECERLLNNIQQEEYNQ